MIVPFPEPEFVTVHHDWLLAEVQDEFEVIVKLVVPAGGVTFWLGGLTERVGEEALWVTVTVTGEIPDTATVTLAIRCEAVVFSR